MRALFFGSKTDSIETAIGYFYMEELMSKYSKKVAQLRKELGQDDPILPGSISEQWNVCGTLGCKCKDPANPVRHGPYYQLSFSVGGKSSSMFINKKDLAEVKDRIARYRRYKKLVTELIRAYIELARQEGFSKE